MQRKLSHPLLALCVVAVLILTSCHGDSSNNPTDPGSNTATISTTIAGFVSDENGKPLSDAQVKAHGQTVMTNKNGLFVLHNIKVPSDRCFVIVSHNGYFNAARAETPHMNGVTNMQLSMMNNASSQQISASDGGKVSLPGGGVIDLPANGYVSTNGSAYTGMVNVAAHHLDPTSPTFFHYFAGDFRGQRSDGSRTDLLSYGVLRVELTGSTGEKLHLAPGKTATLRYPIPTDMQSGAPSEMPLWYFDEQLGMWKEEGKAVKQGNVYTGEVSHFTDWNCDMPGNTTELSGTVSCDKPIPGVLVTVGERQALTDQNGYYHLRVPTGIAFAISVQAGLNKGISAAPVTVGPFSTGNNATHDILVDPCASYISGTLVDCNQRPIEGVVQLTGTDFTGYMVVGADGKFIIRVPQGIATTLEAFGYDGSVSTTLPVDPVQLAETKKIDNVELCSSSNSIPYVDIIIDEAMLFTLSPDGSRLAVITVTGKTRIYNTEDGTLVQTMLTGENGVPSKVEFSDDGSKVMTVYTLIPNPVNIWDVETGKNLHTFSGIESPHFLPGGTAIIAVETSSPHDVLKLEISSGQELDRYPHGKGSLRFIGSDVNGTRFVGNHSPLSPFDIFVWDMNINALANEFQIKSPDGVNGDFYLSLDRQLLIVPGKAAARLYNASTGELVNTLTIPSPLFSNFALAPDNTSFAGQTKSGQTAIYQNGAVLRLLPTNTPFSDEFVFSREGKRLAAYGAIENGTKYKIRIWQLP